MSGKNYLFGSVLQNKKFLVFYIVVEKIFPIETGGFYADRKVWKFYDRFKFIHLSVLSILTLTIETGTHIGSGNVQFRSQESLLKEIKVKLSLKAKFIYFIKIFNEIF